MSELSVAKKLAAKFRSKADDAIEALPKAKVAKEAAESSSGVAEKLSPFSKLKRGYETYDKVVQQPVAGVAKFIASKIVDATAPTGQFTEHARQQYKDSAEPILGGAIEMGLDPLNLIGPGMGAVSKLHKGLRAGRTLEGARQVLKGPKIAEKALEGGKKAIITEGPAMAAKAAKDAAEAEKQRKRALAGGVILK